MTTVVVWMLFMSISSTSQNRAAITVEDIASETDCETMKRKIESVYNTSTSRDAIGTCIKYSKVVHK